MEMIKIKEEKVVKKIDITSALKQKVADFSVQNGLALVVLFGSQSTGNVHEESDVDIAYQATRPLAAEQEVVLNASLAEIFKNDRLDTVNLTLASPLLANEILEQATVLYDKTGLVFPAFEIRTLRTFEETRPLFEIRHEKILAFAHT